MLPLPLAIGYVVSALGGMGFTAVYASHWLTERRERAKLEELDLEGLRERAEELGVRRVEQPPQAPRRTPAQRFPPDFSANIVSLHEPDFRASIDEQKRQFLRRLLLPVAVQEATGGLLGARGVLAIDLYLIAATGGVAWAIESGRLLLLGLFIGLSCTVAVAAIVRRCLQRKAERNEALATVSENGRILKSLPAEFRADREVALAAVSQNGYALEHASAELQADREVALAAVSQEGYALKYASAERQADREVVMAAVSQHGYALKYTSAELQADRGVVLAAVSQDGCALEYASAELWSDRVFVVAVLAQRGYTLQHASAELRADREVVMAAVSQDGCALKFVSAELQADRRVVMAAVSQDGCALKYASAELRADAEVVRGAKAGALQFLAGQDARWKASYRGSSYRGEDYLVSLPAALRADEEFMRSARAQPEQEEETQP